MDLWYVGTLGKAPFKLFVLYIFAYVLIFISDKMIENTHLLCLKKL